MQGWGEGHVLKTALGILFLFLFCHWGWVGGPGCGESGSFLDWRPVSRLPCLGLSSSRSGRESIPGVLEQTAGHHPAEAQGSPRGGVFLWMERRFLPEERMKNWRADTARHWGHGKRRTENSWGVGEFQGWSRGSYLKHSETQSVPTNGENGINVCWSDKRLVWGTLPLRPSCSRPAACGLVLHTAVLVDFEFSPNSRDVSCLGPFPMSMWPVCLLPRPLVSLRTNEPGPFLDPSLRLTPCPD